MAATVTWYDYTSTNGGVETETTNANLMSTDAHDSGTDYQSNPIPVPSSGTNYSYERIVRVKWTGSYNNIDTVKFWKSAGTFSDAHLALNAGTDSSVSTPTDSASSVATSAIPTAEGSALSVTVSGASPNTVTHYIYLQLEVPNTVTTPGEISEQTLTLKYNEY